MIIVVYLIISIVLLLVFSWNNLKKFEREENKYLRISVLAIHVFVLFSFFVFLSLTNSSNKNLYKNSDFYKLEHDGFKFKNDYEINIYNNNKRNIALWDEGSGVLKARRNPNNNNFIISYSDLEKPLLVSTSDALKNFELADSTLQTIKSNDVLSIIFPTGEQLTCLYKEKGLINNHYQFIINYKNRSDTIYEKIFNKGYPLLPLIEKSQVIQLSDLEEKFIENSYLIRKKQYAKSEENRESPLFFFPGKSMYDNFEPGISYYMINDSIYDQAIRPLCSIEILDGQGFYIGLGNEKTDILRLRVVNDEFSKLEYKLPPKYPLYENDTIQKASLFISTSLSEIIKNSDYYDGVICFEGRSSGANYNHINSSIQYAIEEGKRELNAVLIDFISNSIERKKIVPDQQFEIKSLNKNVTYLVTLKNYNKNPLTRYSWLVFALMAIGVTAILFRINYNSTWKSVFRKNVYLNLELAVNWIIISFVTVRMVLLWRMYAFPPTENITYNEFHILTDYSFFWFTVKVIFSYYLVRFLIESGRIYRDKLTTIETFFNNNVFSLSFIRFALLLVALLAFSHGIGFVLVYLTKQIIVKITLPFLFYLVFTFIIEKFQSGSTYCTDNKPEQINRCLILDIINASFLFGFYFLFSKDYGYVLLISIFLFISIFMKSIIIKRKAKSLWRILFYPVIFFILFFNHLWLPPLLKVVSNIFPQKEVELHRMAYRGEVLTKDVDKILVDDIEFNGAKSNKVLWAAESNWFIKNYLNYRYHHRKGGTEFLTQYSNRGVSYTVQTRELLVLRFLLVEHGLWAPVLLIILLLEVMGLFIYYLFYDDRWRNTTCIVQIILFMVITGLITFFVSINRMIFIGQDFPFLTLTSGYAILAPFAILLFIPLFINTDKLPFSESNLKSSYQQNNIVFVGLAMLLTVMFINVSISSLGDKNKDVNNVDNDSNLAFKTVLPVQLLKGFVDNLNRSFSEAQAKYKSDNNIEILRYGNIDDVLDNWIGLTPKQRNSTLSLVIGQYFDALDNDMNKYQKYVQTAFESFFNTEKQDINHILHIRKERFSDNFEFVVNKQYYFIPPVFEEETDSRTWKGDILAMNVNDNYSLTPIYATSDYVSNNNFYINDEIPYEDNVLNHIEGTAVVDCLPRRQQDNILKLFKVPKEWLFQNKDIIIARIDETVKSDKKLLITNRANTFSKTGTRQQILDCILMEGDMLKIDILPSMRLDYDIDNYLAKNYNYNGQDKFFYPLGKDFVWAYNFASVLKGNYDNRPIDEDYRTSLDYDLFKTLLHKSYSDPRFDDLSVSLADADGNVRLLFDYNHKYLQDRIDPNNARKMMQMFEEIYFNTRSEEIARGNRCILISDNGFGSTIKPFVYSSVTSGYRFHWEQLFIHNLRLWDNNIKNGVSYSRVKNFGNARIPDWNENLDFGEFTTASISNKDYIIRSKNIYNVMMVLFGSYPKSVLENWDNSIVKADLNTLPVEQRFPRFNINGAFYVLSDNFSEKFDFHQSILEKQLIQNFGFKINDDKLLDETNRWLFNNRYAYNSWSDSQSELFEGALVNSNPGFAWVFPEKQSFTRYSNNNLYLNIINPGKGGEPFRLTQIGMVENALRLFTFNQNFNLRITENGSLPQYQIFNIDDSWGDNSNYEIFNRKYIYGSLQKVLQMHERGTARILGAQLGLDRSSSKLIDNRRYYFYAKTGTHNYDVGTSKNDKELLFIITNYDMSLPLPQPNDFKAMAMLITAYNKMQGEDMGIYKFIIEEVLRSQSFKKYFSN